MESLEMSCSHKLKPKFTSEGTPSPRKGKKGKAKKYEGLSADKKKQKSSLVETGRHQTQSLMTI